MRGICVTALATVLLASACGTAGGDLATARSGERGQGTASAAPGDGDGSDICEGLLGLAEQQDSSLSDGPEAVAEAAGQVRALAADAPEEVADALEVFADLFEQMAHLESEGPEGLEAFGEILSQMMDPEVVAASETLTEYMVEECGVDPASAGQQFGVDPFAGGGDPPDGPDELGPPETDEPGFDDGGDPSDISLEDLDAIKEANEGASWVDKVYSTGIGNNRSIQLAAPGRDSEFGGEQLSTAEALEACEAVRTALEQRQPELTVEVMNGETTVASGAAGVPCTAE